MAQLCKAAIRAHQDLKGKVGLRFLQLLRAPEVIGGRGRAEIKKLVEAVLFTHPAVPKRQLPVSDWHDWIRQATDGRRAGGRDLTRRCVWTGACRGMAAGLWTAAVLARRGRLKSTPAQNQNTTRLGGTCSGS